MPPSASRTSSEISIPALREEGDAFRASSVISMFYFYPRPPRGGRPLAEFRARVERTEFLSPPSARRATQKAMATAYCQNDFYPRPPRGGRRRNRPETICTRPYFYPRPPRGGRLNAGTLLLWLRLISIPALREEGDFDQASTKSSDYLFLSPPSARRATEGRWSVCPHPGISIPALREEGDSSTCPNNSRSVYFYPRPPRGGRPGLQHYR